MIKGLVAMGKTKYIGSGQEGFAGVAEMVKNKLGFNIIQLTPKTKIPSNINLIISRYVVPSLVDLDKKIKLITWIGDVNISLKGTAREVKERKDVRKAIFERSDLILSCGYSEFEKDYPQFMNKMIFFPKNFGFVSRFRNIKFNKNPKMKCLLPGSLGLSIYPLRNYIKKHNEKKTIDFGEKIPKKNRKRGTSPWQYAGGNYIKWLNSYFCCVTSSSIFNYVVGKYFEIPATGSLLLANETEDSKRAGFIPYEHFIPVTKKNAISQIEKCLRDPKKFNKIRKAGMRFVKENHSVGNRFEQLKKIIMEM